MSGRPGAVTTAASRWRRRLGLAAVAAVIATVVAVLAGLPQVKSWLGHYGCPVTEQSSAPAVGSSAPPTVLLVTGPSLTPTFPLTPSYLPFGVQQPPTLSMYAGTQQARYGGPGPHYQDITLQRASRVSVTTAGTPRRLGSPCTVSRARWQLTMTTIGR